jgi:hypothetical protein
MTQHSQVRTDLLDKLYLSLNLLACLEANGVDNWHGYGCLCQDFDKEGCIFCAEDPIKYLNLKEEGK